MTEDEQLALLLEMLRTGDFEKAYNQALLDAEARASTTNEHGPGQHGMSGRAFQPRATPARELSETQILL